MSSKEGKPKLTVAEEVDAAAAQMRKAADALAAAAARMNAEVSKFEELRAELFTSDAAIDEMYDVFKQCLDAYGSTGAGHYTSVDAHMRDMKVGAAAIACRVAKFRRDARTRSRAAELGQKFTVGAAVKLDESVADVVRDAGVCYEREVEEEHSLGYYQREPPKEAIRFDPSAKKYWLKLKTPRYDPLRDKRYKSITIEPEQIATVVDCTTSKTYVKVSFGDPPLYVWMKRAGLIVAHN